MHSIYRVRKHLRDVSKGAYEPDIIAIGPYHRGKDNLKMMEEHKTRYLNLLLQRIGQDTMDKCKSAIEGSEEEARKCYAEPLGLGAEKFTEMLLRDGCFIIELLRKNAESKPGEEKDPILEMVWMKNSLQLDLLLFENQIPFFVLRKLFDLIHEEPDEGKLINLVLKFWDNCFLQESKQGRKMTNRKKTNHLLDLVHQYCRPSRPASDAFASKGNQMATEPNSKSETDHCQEQKGAPSLELNRESIIIHSATLLKKANVKFQKREDARTSLDVDFKDGKIQMLPLTIEDRTECFFRNFIAHEHYSQDGSQANYVEDYAWLLNCLIDSPEDVDILCQAGIINNLLGDNKAVAQFVNRLSRTVCSPHKSFAYAATFKEINKYYKKGWNRACAALKRDYCYSPWATVAVLAASVILLLTLTQTVSSVLQLI